MWRQLGMARLLPGGGLAPIEWQELAAFARMAGHDITPVEASVLIDMSAAYAVAIMDNGLLSKPPMEREPDD